MLDMKGVTERLVKYKILVVVGGPVGPGTKINHDLKTTLQFS